MLSPSFLSPPPFQALGSPLSRPKEKRMGQRHRKSWSGELGRYAAGNAPEEGVGYAIARENDVIKLDQTGAEEVSECVILFVEREEGR